MYIYIYIYAHVLTIDKHIVTTSAVFKTLCPPFVLAGQEPDVPAHGLQ